MDWAFFEIKQKASSPPLHQPYTVVPRPPAPPPPPPPPPQISSMILLIIMILSITLFISGLLHLLVRFLLISIPTRDPDDMENVTALQGQLQQLFNLHDAGVDQSLIDTLPLFLYRTIIGLKVDPFDCAICLCEFEPQDKLRLLPKCSHAFHMECIDTWLLSHTTCPLCRSSLLPDFPSTRACSSIVFVLESASDSYRENGETALGRTSSVFGSNSYLGIEREAEFESTRFDFSYEKNDAVAAETQTDAGEKIVRVKLGKLRNLDGGEGSSENDVHSMRSHSMGSFAYVLDEASSLRVPVRRPMKKKTKNNKRSNLPLKPGSTAAISEYGSDNSRRDFNAIEAFRGIEIHGTCGGSCSSNNGKPNAIHKTKRESFSISKIWLRGVRKEKTIPNTDSAKRAFSFRFPVGNSGKDSGISGAGRNISEIEMDVLENDGSEMGLDEETQSCYSLD
ncbi:hypothetical protein Dimus_002456 [Dionaea muscipula]